MDPLHVFGCGVNRKIFETKFNALDQENQRRIERVARRIKVTLKMRYEIGVLKNPFESSFDNFLIENQELSAIRVYLLFTCLDTLAGKPHHMDFRDWLHKQQCDSTMNKDEIINLYDIYMSEYGVGQNLRDLFNTLPLSTKKWLVENVVIREIGQPIPSEGQPVDQLIKRLYSYFYEIQRNDFTHNSITRAVFTSEDIREPDENGCWVTPASGLHFMLNRHKPKKLWNFSYRQGLDEATILQIIIHSAALRILNIPVTEKLINKNLHNFSRLDGLYSFMNEIESNANLLKIWLTINDLEKSEFKSILIHNGVPMLSDQSANRMMDRYEVGEGWEKQYHQITFRYIQLVAKLNTKIAEFNENNPPYKQTQESAEDHWETIIDFLSKLSKNSSADSILKFPSTNEVTNLWLIIRNPCYI